MDRATTSACDIAKTECEDRSRPWRAVQVWAGLLLIALILTVARWEIVSRSTRAGEDARSLWLVFAAIGLVILAVRTALWARYRPVVLSARERVRLPSLTVVIPAFNEGGNVARTIESVMASDYPTHLLSVIAVDDGSTDDTGAFIDRVARRFPERVTAIHLPANQGKRHALYAGFRRATTELIATVDSDSVVPPASLANLVAPMLRDPRIGGVAGKVTVDNRRANLLTRMLGVRYILGFDYVRAYQSELRTVWCCPGALQAYRRGLVQPHLGGWLNQTFLGSACTNGDDHAMTNLVLSLGADTVYQSTAEVRTLVPVTYARLCKMYIRWGRSATREGLLALRFAVRRGHDKGGLVGPLVVADALLQPIAIAARVAFAFALPLVLVAQPQLMLNGLSAGAVSAVFYSAVFLRSERSFAVVYGALYTAFALLTLFWVQPFATITVRRNGWMTRGP